MPEKEANVYRRCLITTTLRLYYHNLPIVAAQSLELLKLMHICWAWVKTK